MRYIKKNYGGWGGFFRIWWRIFCPRMTDFSPRAQCTCGAYYSEKEIAGHVVARHSRGNALLLQQGRYIDREEIDARLRRLAEYAEKFDD